MKHDDCYLGVVYVFYFLVAIPHWDKLGQWLQTVKIVRGYIFTI